MWLAYFHQESKYVNKHGTFTQVILSNKTRGKTSLFIGRSTLSSFAKSKSFAISLCQQTSDHRISPASRMFTFLKILTQLYLLNNFVVFHTVIKYIVFWGDQVLVLLLYIFLLLLNLDVFEKAVYIANLPFFSSSNTHTSSCYFGRLFPWARIVAAIHSMEICHLILGMRHLIRFVIFVELGISWTITGWEPAVLYCKRSLLSVKYSNFLSHPDLPSACTWVFFIRQLKTRHCVLSLLKLVLTAS